MPKLIETVDTDHEASEAVEMLKRAEEWALDLAKRGHPMNEVRDVHFCLLLGRQLARRERERAERLATVVMALVARAGGRLDILEEETDALKGTTLIESSLLDAAGITLQTIVVPSQGLPS